MRTIENWPTAAEPLAFGADLLQTRHHVADVGAAFIIALDCDGLVEPTPGFEVPAFAVEDLHAVRTAVDHDDTTVRKGPDRMRPAELTIARPLAAPACDQSADGRLYESDRPEIVWTAEDIRSFCGVASIELQAALLLALLTGQRRGDLLRLTWSNYDG